MLLGNSGRGRSVLLIGDVGTPHGGATVLVHLLQREMGHEAIGRGAVPVILAGLEEDPVAGADDLNGAAATLHETDTLDDEERLPKGVGVPRRPRTRGEMDDAGAQARQAGGCGYGV